MACYLVTYDLRKERNYEALHNAIKSYGLWAKILESTWAVVSDKTAMEVTNHLKNSIDNDDGIFVVKSASEAAWTGVNCSNEWLKANL